MHPDTDASTEAAGAVLSQMVDSKENAETYCSKTFASPQLNYCVSRRKLLAVVLTVSHFRSYLNVREFHLSTDHALLIGLHKRIEPSDQVTRWLEL